MVINEIIKKIKEEFPNKKILEIFEFDGKYYFNLKDDYELDETSLIRYFDPKKGKTDLLSIFSDLDFYDQLLKGAKPLSF